MCIPIKINNNQINGKLILMKNTLKKAPNQSKSNKNSHDYNKIGTVIKQSIK